WPQRVNLGDDTAMNALSPSLEATAHEAGQQFNFVVFGRRQGGDAFVAQVSRVVECARIAIIAWRNQGGTESDPLTITQKLHARLLGIDTDAEAGARIYRLRVGVKLIYFNINSLPPRFRSFLLYFALGNNVRGNSDLLAIAERWQCCYW